jgi:hypothetical protein
MSGPKENNAESRTSSFSIKKAENEGKRGKENKRMWTIVGRFLFGLAKNAPRKRKTKAAEVISPLHWVINHLDASL